jgi:Mn2+/Fe2+ NRAMP family transporter
VILICMMVLINDRDIMGGYVNPPWLNTVMWLVIMFLTILTLVMLVSIFMA